MATISDITNASNYRGQANAGGSLGIGITIDNSPLQRLATFAYYRDRDLWEKKQRDDAIAANKIALITAFDVNSPLKPYADDLLKRKDKIRDYIRNRPTALSIDKDKEGYQELYTMIGEFENAREYATKNDVLFNAAKSKTEQIQDPAERDLKKRELNGVVDELFAEGIDRAYNKQLMATPELKPSDYTIPTVALTSRDIILERPNENITTKVTYADLDDLRSKAELLAAGGTEEDISSQDWFQRLSPQQQKIELDKSKLTGSKRKALVDLSVNFSNALQQWRAANPNIDLNTVNVDSLPDGIIENNIRSAKQINEQIDELNSLVLQGKIADPAGRVRTKPYAKISFDDGLTEAELIVMKSLQDNKNSLISKVDKAIQETDNELERKRISLGWANVNKDAGLVSKDAIENPAIQFGEHINRVKTYFNNNTGTKAMIVRFSALDEDTKKALGLYKQNDEGKLEPVNMGGENSYVTYFNDGTYRVGTNFKGKGGNPGTLETLRQGYINSVKAGLNKEGVQSEGFQKNAEDGFKKIFGANNSEAIWDSWGGGKTKPTSKPNTKSDPLGIR